MQQQQPQQQQQQQASPRNHAMKASLLLLLAVLAVGLVSACIRPPSEAHRFGEAAAALGPGWQPAPRSTTHEARQEGAGPSSRRRARARARPRRGQGADGDDLAVSKTRALKAETAAAASSSSNNSPKLEVPTVVAGKNDAASASNDDGGHQPDLPEESSIQPIDIPFLQEPGGWQLPGNGISLDATGEPKSGTTWLGRLVPDLALHLCGNANNTWCEMGGLEVINNLPAPKYVFEMVHKTAKGAALYLRFDGNGKHYIPGMKGEPHPGCENGGSPHPNFFGDAPPCLDEEETPTRERLRACLFNTSALCVQYMPSVDPDVRRSMVIVRDPRDVAMSEREMRMKYYPEPVWIKKATADVFARRRFEALVSWTHQRYLWHTETVMAPSSHVVFYEDLKENHHAFIGMAAFMGLACSEEDALEVWRAHRNAAPHGDYSTRGLHSDTIQWMNETMARLLPPSLALRWGVTPTDDLGA